jgi:hypothetical protein
MQEATKVALLTIRAWCEEGSTHPLRAEIRLAHDVSTGFRPTVTVIHTDAVMEAVREFLDGVLCLPPIDAVARA